MIPEYRSEMNSAEEVDMVANVESADVVEEYRYRAYECETTFLVPDLPVADRRISASGSPLFIQPSMALSPRNMLTPSKVTRLRPSRLQLHKENNITYPCEQTWKTIKIFWIERNPYCSSNRYLPVLFLMPYVKLLNL